MIAAAAVTASPTGTATPPLVMVTLGIGAMWGNQMWGRGGTSQGRDGARLRCLPGAPAPVPALLALLTVTGQMGGEEEGIPWGTQAAAAIIGRNGWRGTVTGEVEVTGNGAAAKAGPCPNGTTTAAFTAMSEGVMIVIKTVGGRSGEVGRPWGARQPLLPPQLLQGRRARGGAVVWVVPGTAWPMAPRLRSICVRWTRASGVPRRVRGWRRGRAARWRRSGGRRPRGTRRRTTALARSQVGETEGCVEGMDNGWARTTKLSCEPPPSSVFSQSEG